MSTICLLFLIASYITSGFFDDPTYLLFGIGFVIFWYLDYILEELKKK